MGATVDQQQTGRSFNLAAYTYKGKKVLVMGLGLHGGGTGVARFLYERGASVTVTDLRTAAELEPSLASIADLDVNMVLGGHRESDFRRADLIIRNPAVPDDSTYLKIARAHGTPIEMEMGLFFGECDRRRIIGVTGTRGKSTTATFIHHLLTEHGVASVLAGNIRRSAVALLSELKTEEIVVLELSSWQLEALEQHAISPGVAVVTNILPDHLNRYPNMSAYEAAKTPIVRYQEPQDLAVLNNDNSRSASFADITSAQIIYSSTMDIIPGWDDAHIKGDHNRANLAAAIAATTRFQISKATVAKAVRSFAGVPYRLQLIGQKGGVRYINDTCSTTPDATLAALATMEDPIVLIAGGSDKSLMFEELGKRIHAIGSQMRLIILLPGEGTARLRSTLPDGLLREATSMKEAVEIAADEAQAGDAVLLSPACASFGLFDNEFHRGDLFNQSVANL
jgi:UDP-N-acetylmuramoylalanine--D-glutamate ligase